ncbi:MAG: hypothetical protein LBR32_08865 [Propionibacteriaceae bacterium]|nr:hypothetical protein [Propionibacteriaceae bacterium]
MSQRTAQTAHTADLGAPVETDEAMNNCGTPLAQTAHHAAHCLVAS